jgi:hypothetical protein
VATAAAGDGGIDGVLMHSRDQMLKSYSAAAAVCACGAAPEKSFRFGAADSTVFSLYLHLLFVCCLA